MTGTKKNCNYLTNNLHFTLQSDSYAINTHQLASLTLMKKSNSPGKNCATGNLLLLCQYPNSLHMNGTTESRHTTV
jgi:hypothetical protein